MKNRYIERTFIMPEQTQRDEGVLLKLNPIRSTMNGKRVVIVDDSIVRGTTMRKIVQMTRRAGAKEVHVRIGCPPIIAPCYYGIDMKTRDQFAAINRSFEDWRADVEADARQIARRALILDEVGAGEKMEITGEELDAEIHRIADSEHTDAERIHARLHDSAEMSRLVNRLYHRKILQFLVDNAEITEEIVEPTAEDEQQTAEQSAESGEPATEG